MIVSFSVSNFRSFSEEETISLVASNRLSGIHDDHAVPIPDSKKKVLMTAVLYGANGAGKSNLLKALRHVKSVALSGRTVHQPFRFAAPANAPSTFDLQFIAADRLYRFGFKVDEERITEEWLFQVVGNQQKPLYERTTDENGRVTVDAQGLKDAGEKVMALATVGGPQDQSFLATANATLGAEDLGGELGDVLTWFKESLRLISPDESIGLLGHLLDQDPDFLSFAGAFLKSASTGVDHLEVLKKEIAKDELGNLAPDWVFRGLTKGRDGSVRVGLGGNELLVERKGENRVYRISVQAAHEHEPGTVVPLELSEESDGTRRLLNLIPALHHLRTTNAVYFIDEIDRSLHPTLVREFLEFFLKSRDGGTCQLIVTTHESSLLDQDLLRRDEIWFAEKDQTGATRLYSLLDFKVRNDLEIRKHYLQGRFGAVPFLGGLENLSAKTDRPE
ncbi:MAG TPA: ATP-binding protein [Bryobacteraceae bacterium]|nr:ATP-binding protein [Bryobacteraceae bacterium]